MKRVVSLKVIGIIIATIGFSFIEKSIAEDPNRNHGYYQGRNNDAIDMFTGTLTLTQNDLTLPGRNGLNVVITRAYSSDTEYEAGASTEEAPQWDNPKPKRYFGQGWHYLIARIHDDTLYYGDGSSEELFEDSSYPEGMRKSRQFAMVTDYDSLTADTMFTLNGTKMIFGQEYRFIGDADNIYGGKYVEEIVDSHGNKITVDYFSSYPYIDSITDAIGRNTWFHYDDTESINARLLKIEYKNWDDSLISVDYEYAHDTLYSSTNPLVKVKYPSGDSILYAYTDSAYWDSTGSSGSYRSLPSWKLSEITLPYGGKISYDYEIFKKWQYRIRDSSAVICSTHCVWPDSCDDPPCNLQDCMLGDYWVIDTCNWEISHRDYYTWSSNVRSKTRIYTDESTDSTKFDYTYAPGSCKDDENVSSILYPDSSYSVYWHYGHDPESEEQACNGIPAFALILYRQYDHYVELPEIPVADTLFERQWFIGDSFPFVISSDHIRNVQIGSKIGSPGTSIYQPVVFQFNTGFTTDSVLTTTIRSDYDTHTGTFTNTTYTGGSRIDSVFWDSETNRSYPKYSKNKDTRGSYSDSTVVRFEWDLDDYELDEIRKYYDGDSLVTKFTYDSYGNREKVISPSGDTLCFEYGAACSSAFLTRAYSPAVEYDFYKIDYYINVGAKKWEISPNDDTTRYVYDDANKLIETIRSLEPGSFSFKTIYDDASKTKIDSIRIDSSTVVESKSVFNEFNWPVKVQKEGEETSEIYSDIEYDNMGRIKRTSRPHISSSDTVWTESFYDGLGRKYKTLYPDGTSDSTYYDDFHTEGFDKMGRKAKTILNEYLQVEKVVFDTTSSPDTISYQYGPWDKVVKETDPRGLEKKYWYDIYGRLRSDSTADQGRRYYYYDRGNNLRFAKDATGTWKYIKYDDLGRDIEIGSVLNPDTALVDSADYPDTNYTWYVKKKYDDYSASYEGIDSTIINPKGSLVEIEDKSGKTAFFYDDRNRLAMKQVEIDGLTWAKRIWYHYNRGDQLIKIVYPDSSEIEYEYYESGRLSRIPDFIEASSLPTGIKPGITYEPWGSVKSITYFIDNNYRDTYSYDGTSSRLTKIYSHNESNKYWGQTYKYDDVGNIVCNRGLDSLGKENTADTLGFFKYDYTYDLIEAEVKSGAVEKELKYGYYDKSGNREYKKVDADSVHYTLADSASEYFTDNVSVDCDSGNPIDIDNFIPANLDTITWDCVIEGDPTDMANFRIYSAESTYVDVNIKGTLNPDEDGAFVPVSTNTIYVRIELTSGDGEADGDAYFTNEHNVYRPTNKLSFLSGQNPDNFVYDEAGRLIADSASNKEYDYNDLGQLVKYTKDDYDRLLFEYDFTGKRVKKSVITGIFCDSTEWNEDNSNDHCAHDTSTCWFVPGDVDGDDKCDADDYQYLWNYLYGIGEDPGPPPPYPIFRADINCDGNINGTDYTNLYNYVECPFPPCIPPKCCYWIRTDTVSTYYIYSNGNVIAEYDDSEDLAWNYIYGLGQRLARFKYTAQDTVKQIYHNDHLGNVRALTAESGSVISQVDYYPFGDELGLTGSPGRFTYNGNEFDDDYGFDLYYYGARYMDPALGRFTTPDPVKDFVNPYSYVRNNPMNLIDPTGMASFPPFIFNQGPMPNPGANNPFWWVAERIYKKWMKNNYSQPEIDWNSSLLNDEENTKSSDTSEEIKEGTAEEDLPEPGELSFIGPVSQEEQAKYFLRKAISSPNPIIRDIYLSLALKALTEPDFTYVTVGFSGTYVGLEFADIYDRYGRNYKSVAITGPASSMVQGSIMMGWFDEDFSADEIDDIFTSGWDFNGIGVSAAGGIAFDVYGEVNGNSFYGVGVGGAAMNPYTIIYSGEEWPLPWR